MGVSRWDVPLVEFDGHDAKHAFPIWLILEDLAELGLGGFPGQEEIQRLVE